MKPYVKNTFLLSLLFILALGAAGQKPGAYQAEKYSGLGPKDGAAYLNAMHYDEKSKFMYLISNDSSKVYIDILLGDRAAIQKTMAYGLTTWIDPSGKKKKSLGIVFPVPGSQRDMGPGRQGGKDMKGMRELAMKEKNSRMLLKGFSGKGSEEEINPGSDTNFNGMLESLEGGKIRVFLAISLNQIGQPGAGPFSVGFETGYMDLNETGMVAGGSPQGGGDYHRDGPPGGGPPSGSTTERAGDQQKGNQNSQPDLDDLAKPSRMWVKQVMMNAGE